MRICDRGAVTALAQPSQGPPPWKVPAPVAADCAGIRGVYPAHAQHRRAQGRVRGRACQPGGASLKGVLFFKFRTEIFKNSGIGLFHAESGFFEGSPLSLVWWSA